MHGDLTGAGVGGGGVAGHEHGGGGGGAQEGVDGDAAEGVAVAGDLGGEGGGDHAGGQNDGVGGPGCAVGEGEAGGVDAGEAGTEAQDDAGLCHSVGYHRSRAWAEFGAEFGGGVDKEDLQAFAEDGIAVQGEAVA